MQEQEIEDGNFEEIEDQQKQLEAATESNDDMNLTDAQIAHFQQMMAMKSKSHRGITKAPHSKEKRASRNKMAKASRKRNRS